MVREVLDNSNGFALPGWEPERLAGVQELFAKYKDVDDKTLRTNLVYFLERVIPVCEEVGVKMAIHPDDPPYSIFGLPRVVKTATTLTGSVTPSTPRLMALRCAQAPSVKTRKIMSTTSSGGVHSS